MELVDDSCPFALKICHFPLEEWVGTFKLCRLDFYHL